MAARLFYHSKTGNTKKVAEAMAASIGIPAERIEGAARGLEADLLFLGAAMYATSDHGPVPAVLEFIQALDPAKVKEACVFTTGFKEGDGLGKLRGLLERRGIKVRKEAFFCPGRFFFFFNPGRPNGEDLKRAGVFGFENARSSSKKR